MSWRVNVIKNTVKVSDECIQKLWDYNKKHNLDLWYDIDDIVYDGVLFFNEDNMEWVDYLSDDEKIINILRENNACGEVCYGALEGDNCGSFWGHRFDGKGGYKSLNGILTFVEED